MKSIKDIDKKHIINTYNRYDLELVEGMGVNAYDIDNKEYIDLSAGIGVNSLGFCEMGWVASVTQQLCKLNHVSNLFYFQPDALLAKSLCERTGYDKVFFANSGAEANEGAIKIARKYSFDKYGKGRHTVVTLVNSFHGRTIATLTATGQDVYHNYFFPFNEGFEYVAAGIALLIWLLRFILQAVIINQTAKEMGEARKYYFSLPVFDLLQPIQSLNFKLCRFFRGKGDFMRK